ncbi:glutathione gamma-glutamylcysteinyltransferase 3-like isoform X2 [Camellia sinensis]|uniref:glutathione gamma-glutamylcysteinyltransferase 3-like isoform X2 n=1 Tax=Camellia sinensis TaxID=4442 RepID=UPI0010364C99|nr:glutathione gamma-glutamylcysteinyltransferase 3-like isoform X2 [Camellia sinensis]
MGNVQKKGITSGSFAELARKHVDIEAFKAQHSSLEQFTNCVIQTTSTEELYMILSYSRKTVNQTGDGHFSPMAAYHKGRDMLLILDVARYKYPFHWLPRMTVWDAMNKIDKETDETRGKHVDIEAFKTQHSSLEQFTNCVIQTTSTEELYMILSYSRKTVNQGRDMLLILDVARYKYPFHWLPRMTVWDVMNEIDKETDETRGFMMVRKKIS